MGERSHAGYAPLPTDERVYQRKRRFGVAADDHSNYDPRFDYTPRERIPWKSIALALFLASFGTFLLILSHLVFSGHLPGDSSQAWGFLIIGSLMFIPGFYETRVAYYAWKGSEGYSFSAIPAY